MTSSAVPGRPRGGPPGPLGLVGGLTRSYFFIRSIRIFAVSVRITDVGGSTATAAARATVTSAGPPGTGAPPPPARPRIVRINALAAASANAPIVLNAVTDRPARSISWNLAGDSRPEITCSGAQTAVAFRAPAGSRSVSATALGDGGAGPTLATSFAVAPAPALSRAQRLIAASIR